MARGFPCLTMLHFQFQWQLLAPLARSKKRSLSYSVFQCRKTKTFWFQPKLPSGCIHCAKWPFFHDGHGNRQHTNAVEKNKNGIFCLINVFISRAWERESSRKVTELELESSELNPRFYSQLPLQYSGFQLLLCKTGEQFLPFHRTFVVTFFVGGTANILCTLIRNSISGCYFNTP